MIKTTLKNMSFHELVIILIKTTIHYILYTTPYTINIIVTINIFIIIMTIIIVITIIITSTTMPSDYRCIKKQSDKILD